MTSLSLHPNHIADLRRSGLSDEIILQSRIKSVCLGDIDRKFGRQLSGLTSAYEIPYLHEKDYVRYRIFGDVKGKEGKIQKYYQPKGSSVHLYFPPDISSEVLRDNKIQLYLVEGEKKCLKGWQEGLACPVGFSGVWNWRKNGNLIKDFDLIKLENRVVNIVADSDTWLPHKKDIRKAIFAFGKALESKNATVNIVVLPQLENEKTGLDDFLLKNSIESFYSLTSINLKDSCFDGLDDWHENWMMKKTSNVSSSAAERSAGESVFEKKIFFCAGSFYEYENGVYVEREIYEIRQLILKMLGVKFCQKSSNEVIHSLETERFVKTSMLNPDPNILNLKNGLLNLTTFELIPHTPDYLSTIQLDVAYDSDAKCNLWLSIISDILESTPMAIQAIQEFYGLCLTRDTLHEKSLFLIGDGANGKGVILTPLRSMLTFANYSTLELGDFSDKHYIPELFGKLANIATESSVNSTEFESVFKKVTSGEPLTGDKKFKQPFQFAPFCKMIFSLNELPRVNDRTDAFFRRLLIVRFHKTYEENPQSGGFKQDKNLKQRLLDEKSGILNWMLEGLKRLRQRGRFVMDETMLEEISEFKAAANNVIQFVDAECALDYFEIVTKDKLYTAYCEYSRKTGTRPIGMKKFGKELKRNYKQVTEERNDSCRFWANIRLVNNGPTSNISPP